MVKINSEGYVSFSDAEIGVSPRISRASVPMADRIKKMMKNLEGFYLYNPEFKKGVMLVGISACSEGYEYRVSPQLYTDSFVICDTVEKQVQTMVAPLGKRLSGIAGVRHHTVRRLLFAQVYWISWSNKATLLLDNYEWFNRKSVSVAFSKLLQLKYGCVTDCKVEDVTLSLVRLHSSSCEVLMWTYEYADGKYLMCSTVSGAIIDIADTEIFECNEVDIAEKRRITVLLTRIKIENCNTLNFL